MLMAHAARTTLVTVEEVTRTTCWPTTGSPPAPSRRSTSAAVAEAPRGAWPVGLRGAYPADPAICAAMPSWPRRTRASRATSTSTSRAGAGRMSDWRPQELLIDVAGRHARRARPRRGRRRLADPGCRGLLARERSGGRLRVSVLGSERHNPFTDGGRELFDCAAQGRIDAFFLGGGQIDGGANINLVGVGGYPRSRVRWPGSFGSAYLYFLVPRVILFREEHTRAGAGAQGRVRQRARHQPRQRLSPGRALRAGHRARVFRFERGARPLSAAERASGPHRRRGPGPYRLRLRCAGEVPPTPAPVGATLALIRGPVGRAIAETYPRFAAEVLGIELSGRARPDAEAGVSAAPATGLLRSSGRGCRGARDREHAVARYIAARHARVAAFVDANYGLIGALRLHRQALGLDLLRAPANVALMVPYLACSWAGRPCAARRAACRAPAERPHAFPRDRRRARADLPAAPRPAGAALRRWQAPLRGGCAGRRRSSPIALPPRSIVWPRWRSATPRRRPQG